METQTDTFQIQDGAGTSSQNIQEDLFVEDFESESAMASAQDQREEELQVRLIKCSLTHIIDLLLFFRRFGLILWVC